VFISGCAFFFFFASDGRETLSAARTHDASIMQAAIETNVACSQARIDPSEG
jgi:hypothetical protein